MADKQSIAQILRPTELPDYIGLSRATIHRMRAAGLFPKPVQLSFRSVGFRKAEIDEWLASRNVLTHFCEAFV